jgi:hypothetical protein
MSGIDEGRDRYYRNIDQAGRVNFDRKARVAMGIANDTSVPHEARVAALADYIKNCCINF